MSSAGNNIDVIVFAPHPDDAEIFCGGTIASLGASGHSVAIVDLTRGELSTGGTPKTREAETANASEVLGVSKRINLNFPDGQIAIDKTSSIGQEQLEALVGTIRDLRPKLILSPFQQSRHPDHSATSHLVDQAIFFAGVKKFSPKEEQTKFSPLQVAYYQMRFVAKPSFIVNTECFQDKKLAAINCYQSQISPQSSSPEDQTLLNAANTLQSISARDQFYGSMVGSQYAEPFVTRNAIRIDNPVAFFENSPNNGAQFFWEN